MINFARRCYFYKKNSLAVLASNVINIKLEFIKFRPCFQFEWNYIKTLVEKSSIFTTISRFLPNKIDWITIPFCKKKAPIYFGSFFFSHFLRRKIILARQSDACYGVIPAKPFRWTAKKKASFNIKQISGEIDTSYKLYNVDSILFTFHFFFFSLLLLANEIKFLLKFVYYTEPWTDTISTCFFRRNFENH